MPAPLRSLLRLYWPVALVLVAGLAVCGLVGWELHREAIEIDQKRLAMRIEEVMDQLDGRVEKTEELLQQLQDYLALSGEDRTHVFRQWTTRRGMSWNTPWVCGIMVATNTQSIELRDHLPVPSNWTTTHWETLKELAYSHPIQCRPAMASTTRSGMRYLESYDLAGSRRRTNGFSKAAWSNGLRLSDLRTVMLDRKGQPVPGVLLYMPVHHSRVAELFPHGPRGQPTNTFPLNVRWLNLDAMIIAPVDFRRLEAAVWDGMESDLGVELFTSTNLTAATWLNPSGAIPKAADPTFKAYMTTTKKWLMFSDRYWVFFYTKPLFEAQSPRRLAKTVTVAGAGITLLAAALVTVSLRARERRERIMSEVVEARDALAIVEKERERLGHDLHDGAIQSLYAIQLGLSRTAESVANALPEHSRVLHQTRKRVDEVIAELRRFILSREETNRESEAPGLEQVLASMVQWLKPTTTAELILDSKPDVSSRVGTAQSVALTQIARTALANALRHAQASRITVRLRGDEKAVRLEIHDDGVGFEPSQSENNGMGLRTMRTRVTEAGGELVIDSKPGGGTRVTVTLALVSGSPSEPVSNSA